MTPEEIKFKELEKIESAFLEAVENANFETLLEEVEDITKTNCSWIQYDLGKMISIMQGFYEATEKKKVGLR